MQVSDLIEISYHKHASAVQSINSAPWNFLHRWKWLEQVGRLWTKLLLIFPSDQAWLSPYGHWSLIARVSMNTNPTDSLVLVWWLICVIATLALKLVLRLAWKFSNSGGCNLDCCFGFSLNSEFWVLDCCNFYEKKSINI